MALPLPSVIPNTGAGGGVVTALGGMNSLNNSIQEAKINAVKALYAPVTTQAEAASKLAYANLMGPQFLAKLMGNSDVVANSPQLQDPATLQRLYQAGMGGSTGANALQNLPGMQNQGQPNNSFLDFLKNKLHGIFNGGQQDQGNQSSNALLNNQPNLSNQDRQSINGMQPGQSYVVQGNQGQGVNSGYSYDNQGNNMPATPQEVSKIANQGNNNYAEKAGRFADIKEEGKTLGGERGKAINDLGKQYVQDVEYMKPLDRLAQLTQSPIFMNMRQNMPFFQGLQLQTLGKIGNPEQQKMVGDFMADTKTAIANTVNSFNGRAMAKEFDFANMLKVGDNDTLGVMLGKLESLKTFKQAEMMRNEVARNLMQTQHMNEGDAYKAANSQVDMDTIRDQVSSQLQTPIRLKNKKTGESKLVTPKEYNDMLTMNLNTGRKG